MYLLYFSIDKASPHAPSVVVFTRALSLNSALLLGVRFGLLAAIPAPAFASSVLWPHELSRRMGGAQPTRSAELPTRSAPCRACE